MDLNNLCPYCQKRQRRAIPKHATKKFGPYTKTCFNQRCNYLHGLKKAYQRNYDENGNLRKTAL